MRGHGGGVSSVTLLHDHSARAAGFPLQDLIVNSCFEYEVFQCWTMINFRFHYFDIVLTALGI